VSCLDARAYFGWPSAPENEAERAVRAGLATTRVISRLRTPAGEVLQTRIDIATGLAVVGDPIGEGAAQEQPVVGDTPNLAARPAGRNRGQVVIAEVRSCCHAGDSLARSPHRVVTAVPDIHMVAFKQSISLRFEL
jgi:class 3 adenylate cyclase